MMRWAHENVRLGVYLTLRARRGVAIHVERPCQARFHRHARIVDRDSRRDRAVNEKAQRQEECHEGAHKAWVAGAQGAIKRDLCLSEIQPTGV